MKIYHQVHRPASRPSPTPPPQSEPESNSDGWVGTAVSLGGGLLAVAGGLRGDAMMVAGGILTTGVGTALAAHQVQTQGANTATTVAFVGGGVLSAAGLLLLNAQPAPEPHQGPLPQLLDRLGIRGF